MSYQNDNSINLLMFLPNIYQQTDGFCA